MDLLRERIYAIAAGYEDANDLDRLSTDPSLLLACGRRLSHPLASQPTISRFENSVDRKDLLSLAVALAEAVLGQLPRKTTSVVLDVDATDDPCHGQQEGERFNGYYDAHCYVPLYLHLTAPDGRQRLVAALLRPGNASSKVGLFGLLRRAIVLLRLHRPGVRILLRADSGFGDGYVMAFCREQGLSFVLGLAANPVLRRATDALEQAVLTKARQTGEEVREYMAFWYRADPWPQAQRVVAKVETVQGQLNVRYVVTSRTQQAAKGVYRVYCARGDRENRIKEMKQDLVAGRTSCHRFLANQLRLLLHAAACVLLGLLQQSLARTRLTHAQVGTLRLRLLKVGARVRVCSGQVWLHLPMSCPVRDLWGRLHRQLVAGAT